MQEKQKRLLIKQVAAKFESLCKRKLGKRIESLYLVGSHAFGKISIERPDLNFLLILSGFATPEDYLIIGKICRDVANTFKNRCSVRVEFRPFRYVYPKIRSGYEVFLNPIIVSVEEIKEMGMIFHKMFTEGMKTSNKLLFGSDFLSTVNVGRITKEDVFRGASFDLPFFTLPLTRAPAQYDESETDLLFNEALDQAKHACYLGLEVAMSEGELNKKEFIKYMKNKETISAFYKERYGEDAAKLVRTVFEAREHFLKYKNDKRKAKEMFSCALQLSDHVRRKLFQMK